MEEQQQRGTELLLTSRDSCHCLCAPEGCTGTTIVQRTASDSYGLWKPDIILHKGCAAFGETATLAISTCHRAFVRVCVFQKLGMTHTCHHPNRGEHDKTRLSEADRLEIEEEEAEYAERLEAFMKRYDEAFAAYEGDTLEFVEEWEKRIYDNDAEYLWPLDLDESRGFLQELTDEESSDGRDQHDESSTEEDQRQEGVKEEDQDGMSKGTSQVSSEAGSSEESSGEESSEVEESQHDETACS